MKTKISLIISGLNILFYQLRLSISSVKFYYDVYKIYKGYGIKYLFTISYISSIIYCIFVLYYINNLKDYFTINQLSKNTYLIEYILKQLPNIYYDGNKISLEDETPFYLYDENNNKIAVIDPKNQLSYGEKAKIPIIFTNSKIIIAVIEVTEKKKSNINIEYPLLFGSDTKILTEEVIKKDCANILSKAPSIFIYIFMPIITIFRFITILFEKSFVIILIYVLANFFGPVSSIQTYIRMVLFSSGVAVLLQPIIFILLPEFSNIVFFIQMFANLLLLLGLLQIRNEKLIYD